MSPLSTRYPSPASGDVAEAGGGRHRRPESLADVTRPRPATHARPVFTAGPFTDSFIERGFEERAPRQRRSARHIAGRPPATGSHRAPGTLPIESWLLMGKTRQQVLLASLVAVGLLLLAVPAEQRENTVQAVNTAAQRAAGVPAKTTSKPPAKKDAKPQAAAIPATASPEPSTSAAAPTKAASPAVTATDPAVPAKQVAKAGPGNSLRVTGSATVALTFDDGPDPVQTPKILAMLAEQRITATFCLVGNQVRKHPEIVRQIVDAGHTLCNHTWNHSLTIGKDKPAKIQADLARTSDEIRKAVPGVSIPFFRAPGGNFSDRLVSVAAEQGMTSLYWEVDPRDWDHPDGETDEAHVDKIVNQVRKNVRPGSIVLSHDFNQPDTIAAYEKLLPWLKQNFTLGLPPIPDETPTTTEPTTPAPGATTTPPPPAA
ncbi:MAG: polysaccharide deacetylase family protein [Actinoplanes sp.]